MIVVRVVQLIAGLAGLGALALGLVFWIAHMDFIGIHMLLGLIVALTLLILGILAVVTRGMRLLGAVGIIYAPVVPIFGLAQLTLLIGNIHWLIQTAHLLVSLGALALMGIISRHYRRLKRPTAEVAALPQALP